MTITKEKERFEQTMDSENDTHFLRKIIRVSRAPRSHLTVRLSLASRTIDVFKNKINKYIFYRSRFDHFKNIKYKPGEIFLII